MTEKVKSQKNVYLVFIHINRSSLPKFFISREVTNLEVATKSNFIFICLICLYLRLGIKFFIKKRNHFIDIHNNVRNWLDELQLAIIKDAASFCVCQCTTCEGYCTSICHIWISVSRSRTRTSGASRAIFSPRNSCRNPHICKSSRVFRRRHFLVDNVAHSRCRTRAPFCTMLKHQCQIG